MPAAPASLPARRRRSRWPLLFAAATLLASPAHGAALKKGDILVTDFSAGKLFVIDPASGIPSELASSGYLINPVGVAARADGFAFVTDIGTGLVVRIDPTAVSPAPVQVGVSALPNARGIVTDASFNAFVCLPNSDQIARVDTVTGVGASVSSLSFLRFPAGLVREKVLNGNGVLVDGDLIVADGSSQGSRVIRVLPQNGGQVLLAQDGLLQVVRDIAIDPDPSHASSFLVVDSTARKVFRIDATIPFNASDPSANQTPWAACPEFVSPRGIAVEAGGSVLVSDFGAQKVFRINTAMGPCTALATGSALVGPWDVAVVGDLAPFEPRPLLVADAGTADQVYRVDPTPPGSRTPVPSDLAFANPVAVTRDLNGDLLVLEVDRILRVTGGVQTTVATFAPPVDLTGIAVDNNNQILVTDAANDRLLRVIPGTPPVTSTVADDDGTPTSPAAPIGDPGGLVLDGNGTALVVNRGRPSDNPVIPPGIVRVNPVSGTTTVVTNDAVFGRPVAIARDANGDYLIADQGNDTVWRYLASTPTTPLLFPISVGNQIESLRGIAVDANRTVLVSNQGTAMLLRIDPVSGVQSVVPPVVAYSDIQGIALDQNPDPQPLDSDSDTILEAVDNCAEVANTDQLDTDHDGRGDVCDDDDDADGVLDVKDNCRTIVNPDQIDANQDGFGNLCDADFDENGAAGIGDFGLFRQMIGQSVPNPDPNLVAEFDLDSNGAVGLSDLGVFRSLFGHLVGPSGLSCAGVIPCIAPP